MSFLAAAVIPLAWAAAPRAAQQAFDRSVLAAERSIVVVDGETGDPVEGAIVRWVPHDHAELIRVGSDGTEGAGLDRRNRFVVAAEACDRSGTESIADAHGVARIESNIDFLTVVASKHDRWGATQLGPIPAGRLELFPVRELLVRVTTADGRPASGVPVALRHRAPDEQLHDALEARTGADGIAVLAFAAHVLFPGRASDPSVQGSWSIALDLCATNTASVPIDPSHLPDAPIDLELPATGEVEVIVTDGGRARGALEHPVLLTPRTDESWSDGRVGTFLWIDHLGSVVPVRSSGAWAADGRALLPCVGLGQDLVVLVKRNPSSATVGVPIRGPDQPGQRVTVEIDLAAHRPTFRGRLVTEEGAPLASARLLAELYAGPSPTRTRFSNRSDDDVIRCHEDTLRTDAGGAFTLSFDPDQAHGGRPLLVLTLDRNRPDVRSVRLDLQAQWTAGVHDLGDVVLPRSPLLVVGRVVDATGAGIAGADVFVAVFKGQPRLHARSDAAGRFEIRTAEPHDSVDLHVEKKGHARTFVHDLAVGRSDVTVELHRAGAIAGRVLLPDGARRSVSIRFAAPWTGTGVAPQCSASVAGDGAFDVDGLYPGPYEVSVDDSSGAIVARTGVEIRPDEVESVVLDARGALRAIDLRVVDAAGNAVPSGCFLARKSGNTSIWDLWSDGAGPRAGARDFDGGEIHFTTVEPAIDVSIAAPGFRHAHRKSVATGDRIVLEKALPLRIELAHPVGPPPSGATFEVELIPREAGRRRGKYLGSMSCSSSPFDSSGTALAWAPAPGTYSIRWCLRTRFPGGMSARTRDDPVQTIDVLDREEVQVFCLTPFVEPEELAADHDHR